MRQKKYLFDKLVNVGDAFDVPISSVVETSLRNYAYQWGKRLGKKFSVRVIPDDGVFEVSLVPTPPPEPEIVMRKRRPDPERPLTMRERIAAARCDLKH